MPRRRRHAPLRVLLNNRLLGHLSKATSGAIAFQYDQDWLGWEHAVPVSLSLPLREDAYRGAPVAAVFDNLLPDRDALRVRVAEKVGAAGTDAYSLLAAIGHDCVGALQFLASEDADLGDTADIAGEPVDEAAIEHLLKSLAQAPLGLNRDDPFRISVAGVQEKTALLWHHNQWLKPHGATPTTHIFKTRIGQLPHGIDLSNSVENEYYCLKLAAALGLPVNHAAIRRFGETKALVIERFDRRWTKHGRLLRLPQEDCCQALSVPPTRKYQTEGGPGLVQILDLLKGSDRPAVDQAAVLKAQIFFWLIGAPDGHAKNFSIFIGPGGSYRLTPLYDVLTLQPGVAARHVERKEMRLAMSVGVNRHYKLSEIQPRHFVQSAEEARLPKTLVRDIIGDIAATAEGAITKMESELPPDFPEAIHCAVKDAVTMRLRTLTNPPG